MSEMTSHKLVAITNTLTANKILKNIVAITKENVPNSYYEEITLF